MGNIKNFFKNAFNDMKESAKAQHEVNKANFQAAKAEAKANWEEAKAMSNPQFFKISQQKKHDEMIAEANDRIAAAQERIDNAKKGEINE